MSAKTATKARAGQERNSHHHAPLTRRGLPFVALLLTPPLWLLAGLAVRWSITGSATALGLTCAGIATLTCLLALTAWGIGSRRRPLVRWHVVTTVVLVGVSLAVTVAVGPARWWSVTVILVGEALALSWALYRIDALRHDPTEQPQAEDTLTEKLGLKNTVFGKPKHVTDDKGDVIRTEVQVKHGPGETVEVIQQAVPGLESLANAPRGRSRAVPGEGAGESTLTLVRKDVLKELIPYRGPSHPGGCITDPIVAAVYEDTQYVRKRIAGGPGMVPTNYGYMGMARAGKTTGAQTQLCEVATRRNVAVLWVDAVKADQTVLPLMPALSGVVLDDSAGSVRATDNAIKRAIKYRASELGKHGYKSWSPACYDDPRLRMPLLIVHIEEADAFIKHDPEGLVFIASKCLSTGILLGVSLQRADANSMPTGLRFNVGMWDCYGCGDDYSAGFALTDATIAAGAHPENWKNTKPGYHYHEGIGTDEQRWPVVAKSMYLEDAAMYAHTAQWGPQMAPIDSGTIRAFGDWWGAVQDQTTQRRAQAAALYGTTNQQEKGSPVSSTNSGGFTVNAAPPPRRPGEDEEIAEARQEAAEEIQELVDSGELEQPEDATAEELADIASADHSQHIPAPDGEVLAWATKEAAPTPEAAAEAFDRALREIAADPTLRDPDDERAVVFQVDTLVDKYPFRSRPWFSKRLTMLAEGQIDGPDGLVLIRTDRAGTYRLERHAKVTQLPNAQ